MTILYPTPAPVKSARPFGHGLYVGRAARLPLGPTASDREWAACELNADAADYDVIPPAAVLDAMAERSAEMDRYEAGNLPL
jgi:hypothetical protein